MTPADYQTTLRQLNQRGAALDGDYADKRAALAADYADLANATIDVPASPLPTDPVIIGVPAVPTGLAVAIDGRTATLTWFAATGADVYYAVYGQGENSSPAVKTTETTATFTDLPPGDYVFGVYAQNTAGTSGWVKVSGTVQASPVTPTPAPVFYAEIGGIPATAKATADGTIDVSKLTGDCVLYASTTYTVTGDVKANLYGVQPGIVVTVPAGKQITVRGIVAGITFDGQGKGGKAADDDNDNAMVLIEDGVKHHTLRVTGSQGVGACIVGKGVVGYFPEWDHNGASGRGGKSKGDGTEGSGYTEYDAKLHDNNVTLKKTNAANKITRCSDWLIVRPHYYDECGGAQWHDNYCERIKYVDPIFERGTPDKKGNDPFGFRTELGLPGGVTLVRPVFVDIPGDCLSIDESSNVVVQEPNFGKCKYAAELRNMLRPDDATGKLKNGKPVDETAFTCRLYNVSITDATYQDGAGPIVASDASNAKVTLSNNKIVVGPAKAGQQVVKIPN